MHILLFLIGSVYLCNLVKISYTMEFSIEAFRISPTLQALEKCRKSDLLLVASFYYISVPKAGTKREIRETLCEKLVRVYTSFGR